MAAYICKFASNQQGDIQKLLQKINQLEIVYQHSKPTYFSEFDNIIKRKSPKKPFQPKIAIKYSTTDKLCKFAVHNQKCPYEEICRFPHSRKESEIRKIMGPAGCWRLAREGYCLLEQNCIYEHSKFPTENKSNPPKSTFRKCHFCQKHEHKLPIYCPVIPKMDYSTIKAIIKAHEITCNMLLFDCNCNMTRDS